MDPENYKILMEHEGHEVEVLAYPDQGSVALECRDCDELLIEFFETQTETPTREEIQ